MSLLCKAYLGSTSQLHGGIYIFELYDSIIFGFMTHSPCLEMIANELFFWGGGGVVNFNLTSKQLDDDEPQRNYPTQLIESLIQG